MKSMQQSNRILVKGSPDLYTIDHSARFSKELIPD